MPCKNEIEASLQNLTRKTSHMLNIPYNFLNGFELISKMIRGTSQSAEIRQSAEKSHVCIQCGTHVACDKTPNVACHLHTTGLLEPGAGDSSQHCEEIVKKKYLRLQLSM